MNKTVEDKASDYANEIERKTCRNVLSNTTYSIMCDAYIAGYQAACGFKDAEIKEIAHLVVEFARGGHSFRQKDTIEKAKRIIGGEV